MTAPDPFRRPTGWEQAEMTWEPPHDGPLPQHHRNCLGCGDSNPHGHHLEVRLEGGALHARHIFDERHAGAPGITHGGAIATVLDDVFGFIGYLIGQPAVTRSLTVDYDRPVPVGAICEITARLDRREDRKLFLTAEGVDSSGGRLFTARALFLVVDLQHFHGPRGL
ncbi:PaaI family thioesterase [Agrococcus sediminis]|uniref:PaaI family thioesterase n=1 Tax=Agrococcus sediminis TaxID=2599924 RepID=UPI003418E21F